MPEAQGGHTVVAMPSVTSVVSDRRGSRLLAVVASAVLGSAHLLVIGSPPVSARGAPGDKEFVPRSYPRELGQGCRKGWKPWGLRCWRPCPGTHAMLESVGEDWMRKDSRNPVRCVPRRRTRLYYDLKLTARYHFEYGSHLVGGAQGDAGFEQVADHDWTFRPRKPVMLSRRCTLKSVHDIRIADLFEPAIPCRRQKRALDPILPPFSLSEDVSLRTAGTLDGGRYVSNYTEDLRETFWWDDDGQRHSAPCFNASTSTTTGNGPTGVRAVLRTPERSSRFYGLQIETNGGMKTPLVQTGTGQLCPPVPEGARGLPLSPTQPFSATTDLFLDRPKGIEILNLFRPHLYEQFGDATITVHDTVDRGFDNDPQRGTYERLEVTLDLTRCRRQAPPSRCGRR